MKKTIAIAALSFALTLLAACNTVQGVGRDIESIGSTGEKVMS